MSVSNSTSTGSTLPSATSNPACDTNSWTTIDDFAAAKEGPFCSFNFPSNVDFLACCAANQTARYTGVCTQYCVVDKSETLKDFSTCLNGALRRQGLLNANQSMGALGCQGLKKSGGARVERGVIVWLVVGVLISGLFL